MYMAPILPLVECPSLRYPSLVFPGSQRGSRTGSCTQLGHRQLPARYHSLHSYLSISGDAIWRCESFSSFVALQEFELISTATFGGLHNVLRHCATVSSLTLLPASSAHTLGPCGLDHQLRLPSVRPMLAAGEGRFRNKGGLWVGRLRVGHAAASVKWYDFYRLGSLRPGVLKSGVRNSVSASPIASSRTVNRPPVLKLASGRSDVFPTCAYRFGLSPSPPFVFASSTSS